MAFGVALCGAFFAHAQQTYKFTIPAGKQLPYNAARVNADLLESCDESGHKGTIPATPPSLDPSAKFEMLQAERKNDLWETGTPIPVTFADFDTMQKQTPQNHQSLTQAGNRDALKRPISLAGGRQVQEGTLVQLVARVADAHVSDCEAGKTPGGENVNCNINMFDMSDIHVVLMEPGTNPAQDKTNECSSVTTELIPHFRPATWRDFDVKAPQRLVRITGPLFYDGSHEPCAPGKKVTPARRAVWEVHPAYHLEVCTQAGATTSCTQWVSYDDWIKQVSSSEKFADVGKSFRSRCPGSPPAH